MIERGDVIIVKEGENRDVDRVWAVVAYDSELEADVVLTDDGGWEHLEYWVLSNFGYETSRDLSILSEDLKKTLTQKCYEA